MLKYFYIGLLIIAIIGVMALLSYKKESSSTMPVAQTLPTAKFGGVSLRIEYATTSIEQEKGLSGRVSIPSNYGMLFVFPKDGYYGFWMKDMYIPIDIFWLNDKGQVISISQDIATSTYPHVFYSSIPAHYVLETIAGFAREHTIAIGTPLVLQSSASVSK